MKRVVVTGIGMCTPLGFGYDHCWKELVSSKSGIRKLSGFDIDDLKSKIGGQLILKGNKELFPENVIEQKDRKKIEPFIEYALVASKEAITDSGWKPQNEEESFRTGVMVGSGIGGLDGIRKSAENLNNSPRRISPFFIPSCLINLASGHISIKYNFKGPNHSVVTACASGAHAIGDSFRMISQGDADIMVAGGTESACTRFGIAGFCAMRALSTNFNDVISIRIAIGSATAFFVAQNLDINIFDKLRKKKWYIAPLTSSIIGSTIDTFLFFSISFYGTGIPWITLSIGDLAVKVFVALIMLIPFRLLLGTFKAA